MGIGESIDDYPGEKRKKQFRKRTIAAKVTTTTETTTARTTTTNTTTSWLSSAITAGRALSLTSYLLVSLKYIF